MEVRWHSSGRKHWKPEAEDWLCLTKARGSAVERVILHEGSHHYFKALFQYDDGRRRILERTLDDAGPFQFDFADVDDGWIMILAHFFGFDRAPFGSHQSISEISCGEIRMRDGTVEPILMQVNAQATAAGGTRSIPPDPDIALDVMINADAPPVVELSAGDSRAGNIPFHMKTPAPYNTRVYLITDEQIDRAIVPGKKVPLSKFQAAIPFVDIRAGQFAPAKPLDGQTWDVALPVLQLDSSEGLVGHPLIIGDLIRDLRIEALGNRVDASWDWYGPKHWVRVRLDWDFYLDSEWRDTPGRLDVTWPIYKTARCIQLFERAEYRGWNVEVTATPLVFDRPYRGISDTESL